MTPTHTSEPCLLADPGANEPFRILVVDDSPAQVRRLTQHLENSGFDILTAHGAEEAIRVLLEVGPEIVITAWTMPDMTTGELCRAIRSHEGIASTYVMVVVESTDSERVVQAFDAGADDCLPWPLNPRELVARIRAASRICRLQRDLDRRTREVHRINAEMAVASEKLSEANRKLRVLATVDELTGLHNRREAMASLQRWWRTGSRQPQPLSCILLDIDHFKSINDVWGHAVGDTVLKGVARALQGGVRGSDSAFRLGGEEFLVICPCTSEESAAVLAERLRRAIAACQIAHEGDALGVTVSLGVAERTAAMQHPDDLLHATDTALYDAKDSGRDLVRRAGEIQSAAPTDDLAALQPSPRPGQQGSAAIEAPLRVLIVDDDAGIRTLCRRILEREQYVVCEADNGEDALRLARSEAPDVILMDTVLPGIDGLQCTRRLKAAPATQDTPVILASARADATDLLQGMESGADEFLSKPVDARELVLRVRSMARMRREMRQRRTGCAEQARSLDLLLEFARGMVSASGLPEVLESAAQTLSSLAHARRVGIAVRNDLDAQRPLLCGVGWVSAMAALADVLRTAPEHSAKWLQGPLVVQAADEGLDPSVPFDVTCLGPPPIVLQPLTTHGRLVGLMGVGSRFLEGPFTSSDLDYIDLVANLVNAFMADRGFDLPDPTIAARSVSNGEEQERHADARVEATTCPDATTADVGL